jgi:PTH1 family peptidyl-tRNA hydrolase
MFGFRVIDTLSEELDIELKKAKFNGLYGEKKINGEKIILAKPQTFMNLSGDFVSNFANYFNILPGDLIVVYDDIDISLGKIRVKPSGSPGTHNGMKDITKKIGTKEFIRVRVGTGKPQEESDLVDYVLGKFSKEEEKEIKKAINDAVSAIRLIINTDVAHAMNEYN